MKPPLRTKSIGTKVSEAEFAALEDRASASGQRLSEWLRGVLLTPSAATGANADVHVLLAEVVALRTILLNLFFSVANKHPLNATEMNKLVVSADSNKASKAKKLLAFPAPNEEED